ncbi:MAG TPA: DUF3857 domain-containing protein [Candidatus Angelobacter sp.]|nr:DUF3857 domain-containing protein [Candidatus Angelobacter sp.]
MRRLIYYLLSILGLNAIYTCCALGLAMLVSFNINIAAAQQTSYVDPTQQAADDKAQTSKLPAPTETKKDYSKEPYVIEYSRIAYRFESDGTGRREISIRVRVQSEAGVKGLGQLRFGYNSASEKLEIPYVRVIKPDGSVITAGADAVQELNEPIQRTVYTDFHEKHVIVPGLRPGDVLECQTIATIHTPMAPGQFWMQHDFQKKAIVLDEQLEVDIPAARTVKLKTKPGFDPKITESNGHRIYSWSTSSLSREEEETKSDASQEKKKKEEETGRRYSGCAAHFVLKLGGSRALVRGPGEGP